MMLRRLRISACLAVALIAQGAALAHADTPTGDPSANRPLSTATLQACQADPSSQSCVSSALSDINAARASEGVVPMILPSSFGSLSVPQQLFVLANLERVARGLIPALGLSTPLNQDALNGAAADTDPSPTNWYGDAYAANWAGGYPSPLEADFAWMYDDGLNSGNLDCTSSDTSGCWGHRHDILETYDAPLVMGAAETTGQYGVSLAELFVGGDTEAGPGQADAPLAPTWAALTGDTSGMPASPGNAGSTGSEVAKTAVSPPGAHRAQAAAAGTARIFFTRTPHRVARGHKAQITGKVTPARSGRRVELQRWAPWGWITIAKTRLGGGSRFAFAIRGTGHGRARLRVVLAGADGATSRDVTLRGVR